MEDGRTDRTGRLSGKQQEATLGVALVREQWA